MDRIPLRERIRKLAGWRADREPDASWHRPSYHRPPYMDMEEESCSEGEIRKTFRILVIYIFLDVGINSRRYVSVMN